jgi:hypothetical protein
MVLRAGFEALPQMLPEIHVEGYGDVHLVAQLCELARRRAHRVLDERDTPEVHEGCSREGLALDVLGREKLIGRRDRAVEGELPVAVLGHLNERQRRARGRWLVHDRRCVDAYGLQSPQDEFPEEVVAQPPHERRLRPEFRRGDRHVRRRPAGAGGERQLDFGGHLLPVDVRDHLTQGHYLPHDSTSVRIG